MLIYTLWRPNHAEVSNSKSDLDLYKSQLDKIEKDHNRGLLTGAETEQLGMEVARRLLRADAAAETETPPTSPGRIPAVLASAALVLILVPGSLIIHWIIGEPNFPDMPLAQRIAHAETVRLNRPTQAEFLAAMPTLTETRANPSDLQLIQDLREAVSKRSDDLTGYRLLVQSEISLGNLSGAVSAQEEVIRILGDNATANDLNELAELLIAEAGSYVSPEAENLLNQSLALDEENSIAKYYLGLLFAQTGRPDLAVGIWTKLVQKGPADAPWTAEILNQLPIAAQMAGMTADFPSPAELPGPTLDEIAATEELSDTERDSMIHGMIDSLKRRLESEGGTADEWSRLIHSLAVMERLDDAKDSLKKAQTIFADNPDDLAKVLATATQAGIVQ